MDGKTDSFYLKFTSPRQKNLILGTSRAAQGLQPAEFNRILQKKFYNYAFTIAHSPYGPIYLKSIMSKLNQLEKNGIYILEVNPWSISSKTTNPDDSIHFREVNLCIANTTFVNCNPNFQYLYKNYSGNYYKLLLNNEHEYLHPDGWLEITIDMDSASVEERRKKKLSMYRNEHLPNFKFSNLRLEYLKKSVRFLKKHGKVYLVRLPVHTEMLKIENKFMPDFNLKIMNIVDSTSCVYFDLTNIDVPLIYTDGNHLYKKSGKLISQLIANKICDEIKISVNPR